MVTFYTRTGDDGYTGLLGDERVPKYHPRPEAVGTLDEASAALGLARATCREDQTRILILQAQRDLYQIMAEISATLENAARFRQITAAHVSRLESEIDSISLLVSIPSEFILPGDSLCGAALALARTIVRRAERSIARLWHSGEIENPHLLPYLNRLSSLCFVLELLENQAAGAPSATLAKQAGG